MLDEILSGYQRLIFRIDTICQSLEELYREHLVCKPGCSQCCRVERTVCSVEAYVVEQQLLTLASQKIRHLKKISRYDDETCPMLWRGLCVIYPSRPIICRTHGLPLLYREGLRTFVDYCRLNFKQLSEGHEFQDHQIVDMNPFNVELLEIDKKFSEQILKKNWRPDNRKSLKSILLELNLKQRTG